MYQQAVVYTSERSSECLNAGAREEGVLVSMGESIGNCCIWKMLSDCLLHGQLTAFVNVRYACPPFEVLEGAIPCISPYQGET